MSGTKTDKREDFNRLLADCRKGRIDRVLVKSISRFARNTKDCLSALRELMRLGVTVQFEKENIDTGTLTEISGASNPKSSMSRRASQKRTSFWWQVTSAVFGTAMDGMTRVWTGWRVGPSPRPS